MRSETTTGKPAHRAVFLDRDGTINVEKDYLIHPDKFEFYPGTPEAIARLNSAGFLVIVVTNQSGVARGYFDIAHVDALHAYILDELIPFGAVIDGFYFCPHHPQAGAGIYRTDCDCRKGKPGMLLQAAADWGIDLARSFMVGDKDADLLAGMKAGCSCILVRTGYGEEYRPFAADHDILVVTDLAAAVDSILQIR